MKIPSVYLKTFSLVLSLGLIVGESLIATASTNPISPNQGQQTSSSNLLAQRRGLLRFKVQNVRQVRGRSSGGFARGGSSVGKCNGGDISITALVPQNNRATLGNNDIEVEKTVSLNPTFLVHISDTQAREAEFVVLNESKDKIIYQEDISLTGKADMLSLSVPQSTDPGKSVEVGQKYYWSFQVRCDTTADGQGDPFVDGWVEVVPKTGALAGVDNLPQEQRLQVYADNDIWTDLVSSLAQLHQKNPTAWEQDWKSVLESVGLASVMDAPSPNALAPQ